MKFYLSKELQEAITLLDSTAASAMIRERLTEVGLIPEHATRVAIVEKVQGGDVEIKTWALHAEEIVVEIEK